MLASSGTGDPSGSIYLYGLGRIAQETPTQREYFLGDALGSVRQLVDASGQVQLARSYEPFGEVLSSAGKATSSYAFTGEWRDPTSLIYLRAGNYEPGIPQTSIYPVQKCTG